MGLGWAEPEFRALNESSADRGRRGPVPEGNASLRTPEEWLGDAAAWRSLGATHLSVNTMGAGFSVQEHLDAVNLFALPTGW